MIEKTDKILITGGTGFLGSYLVEELEDRGYTDILPVGSKDVNLADPMQTDIFFSLVKPNIVIHAAAKCGGIGANQLSPGTYLKDNLAMNSNVVNACLNLSKKVFHNFKFKKLIGIGTVCSYPKYCPIPMKESDLWNGYPEETNAPYGLTKRMLLAQIQAYRNQWKLPGIFLIPVNLYGPRDKFLPAESHVIPALLLKFCKAIEENKNEVECWGTGEASREFFHVEDAACGIVDAMEKYEGLDPVNLGVGEEIKIKDLVEKIKVITGFNGKITWNTSRPDGQPRRCLDVSRAEKRFNFKAQIKIDQGLKETYEWFKKSRDYLDYVVPIGKKYKWLKENS